MTNQPLEISPVAYARIAGLLYLIIAVFGVFGIAYIPSVIVATGDGAATAANMAEHGGLYRLGIVADIVVLLSEIVLTVMLFVLLKPISHTLSLIAAYARFSMVLVMAVNILINLTPMVLLGNSSYLTPFSSEQLQAAALLAFEVHAFGIELWGILFGLHLVALGYLVLKSGYFPAILGWAMLIGSFGYSLQGLANITFTQNPVLSVVVIALLGLVTIGELAFALWLLIRGVNMQIWHQVNNA